MYIAQKSWSSSMIVLTNNKILSSSMNRRLIMGFSSRRVYSSYDWSARVTGTAFTAELPANMYHHNDPSEKV